MTYKYNKKEIQRFKEAKKKSQIVKKKNSKFNSLKNAKCYKTQCILKQIRVAAATGAECNLKIFVLPAVYCSNLTKNLPRTFLVSI